ncbi:head decoration protein [Streptomyces sp. NPDC059524]|uniref:head decoration protein n=1 Tax=Streptomyces sp. NPDC059524 TaxID=3346856 RepID=UPI0036BA7269
MDIQPITTTETLTADRRWLLSLHGSDMNKTVTLDLSKFTSGTHYVAAANGLPNRLKSGLPLGKITASGLYAPYTSGATDGTQTLAGVLDTETAFNTGSTKAGAALRVHGDVDTAKLPIALTVPAAANRTDQIRFN